MSIDIYNQLASLQSKLESSLEQKEESLITPLKRKLEEIQNELEKAEEEYEQQTKSIRTQIKIIKTKVLEIKVLKACLSLLNQNDKDGYILCCKYGHSSLNKILEKEELKKFGFTKHSTIDLSIKGKSEIAIGSRSQDYDGEWCILEDESVEFKDPHSDEWTEFPLMKKNQFGEFALDNETQEFKEFQFDDNTIYIIVDIDSEGCYWSIQEYFDATSGDYKVHDFDEDSRRETRNWYTPLKVYSWAKDISEETKEETKKWIQGQIEKNVLENEE